MLSDGMGNANLVQHAHEPAPTAFAAAAKCPEAPLPTLLPQRVRDEDVSRDDEVATHPCKLLTEAMTPATKCDQRGLQHKMPGQIPAGSSSSGSWPSDGLGTNESGHGAAEESGLCRTYTAAEEAIIEREKLRWTLKQEKSDMQRSVSEFFSMLEETRSQLWSPQLTILHSLPANRYGNNARLPAFVEGQHVPVLALINPNAGAMAGSDILAIARNTCYYRDRFFNILDVVKDQHRRGGMLDVFRAALCKAKDEARAMGARPRIISGGGDGTASFTLFILFAALRAEDTRAAEGLRDTGNGFIWTDEELEDCFPALAQMPLGSANDLAHTLGWGKKYPGDRELGAWCAAGHSRALRALQGWVKAVVDPASRATNFDMFGIMPEDGAEACDFKVCELAGPRGSNPKVRVDHGWRLMMKEARTPVPLFVGLYFSAGFAAYMTARFQLNRKTRPLRNKVEYARQAAGILMERVPPELNTGLHGVQIRFADEQYFPPRGTQCNRGEGYRDVGFLNVNWQAGMANGADRAPVLTRLFSRREPAKFNDGKMDMYRLKLASALKNPGLRIQTDKKEGGMTLMYAGGRGKGIFFQWDGEARFAFSAAEKPFKIHIRKVLDIPVLLGPEYDPMGAPPSGDAVRFRFAGDAAASREAVKRRVLQYVRGELSAELNATGHEMLRAGLHCEPAR